MFAQRFGSRGRSRSAGVLAVVLALSVGGTAPAADITWGNGSGDFLWNTTSNNWAAGVPWNNLNWDGAIFGGTGVGTVTVSPGINVRSLNFGTTDGYTLTGGSLNLSQLGTSGLGAGQINVGGTTGALTATTATINSNLISSFGLEKIGDGVLVLGGTGNAINGFRQITGSGIGVNVLIGSGTTTAFGGSLRLASATALAPTTTVGLGNGFFDIGTNNVTLAGLTILNTTPSTRTPTSQGVIGTGVLTTQSIRVIGNATGFGSTISTAVDANGGTLRVEVGSGANGANEVAFVGAIQNGSLLKTFGVGTAGTVSIGSFTLHANNTYTGATTLNGGTANTVAGTNASTSLNVVNGAAGLLGASGSYGAATTVRLVSNANLTLTDTAAITAASAPAVAAAALANRINTAAALTLDGGSLAVIGGTTADVTQTVASVSAPQGFNRISLTNGAGFAAVVTVSGNLTLGTGSTLVVGGATMGDTATAAPTATRFVVSGTTPAEVNGLIPGLYTTTTATGLPLTFARNSSTAGVGIVGLAAGDYTTLAAATATTNADVTAAATVAASTSANAVRTSAGITINSGQTLTVGAGGILATAAAIVAGPGTLAFSGAGLLTANAATTLSGPITGSAGLFRSGTGAVTLSGDLSGLTGGLTLAGIGTTSLNTATYAGAITVQGGVLNTNANIGTGGLVTLGTANTPAGTVGAATTLNINTATITTFARNIAVVGGDGTSPFAGTSGMILTALSTANQTVSGTISLGTHLSVNGATTAGTLTTLSGAISGVGGLNVLTGSVALTNAANSFSGGMQLNGGTTSATTDAAFGSGNVRLLGGTIRTDYAGNFNRGVTVLTSSTFNVNGNNVTVTGLIAGENPVSTLTKGGNGVLTVTSASPFPGTVALGAATTGGITLGGANGAFTGATGVTIPTGTALVLDNSATYNGNRLGNAVAVGLNGGLLNYLAPTTATTDPAERFGQLVIGAAGGVLNIDGGSATSPTVLRFAGLTVTSGNATFRGTGLGDTTGNFTRVLFDVAPVANGALLPNAFFAGTSGTTASTLPAVYDFTRGVILFTPPAASGTTIDNFATTNTPILAAFTTTGNTVANTGVQIYSLTLDAGSTLTLDDVNAAAATNNNTAIGTLRLAGGFLTSQNGAKTIQGGAGAATKIVDFGASAGTVTTTSDLTVAAGVTLGGTGGLIKAGAGTLLLNGTYAVTGGLTINAGTVSVPAALTPGPLTVNGGTLNTNGNNLTTTGLAGSGGTVNVGAGILTVNQTTATTYAGNIQSTTGLIKTGVGSLTLSSPTTLGYTGTTEVREGGLVLGATNVLPTTQPLSIGLLTQSNTAFLDLNGNSQTVSGLTFFAKSTGGAAAQVTGAGTLTVNGNIAFVDNTGTAGNAFPVNVAASVTAVNLGGAVRDITLAGNNNGGGDLVFNAPITNGGINYTGTDSSSVSGARAVLTLAATNTYAGGTTVNSGTVAVTAAGNLGTGGLVMNTTATPSNVNFAGSATIASLATGTLGAGAATVNLNGGAASALTVAQATTTTYAGVIAGTGGLTKTGAGTLALTGTNTYTGATTVNAGVLGGTGTLASATTVNAGGFISGGSAATPTGTLTVNANVTLTNNGGMQSTVNRSAANTATAGLVSVGGTNVLNLNPGAGNTFAIRLVSDPAAPMVAGETYTLVTLATVGTAGNIQLNGASQAASAVIPTTAYTLSSPEFATFNSVTLAVDGVGTSLVLTFTPVPEPASMIALGGAVLAAGAFVRRRLRKGREQVETTVAA